MSTTPTIPSTIHLHPSTPSPSSQPYLIFLIPGNPGVIAYYTDFLTHLYGLLSPTRNVHVVGRSFRGFEVDGEARGSGGGKEAHESPYGLEEQIQFAERALGEAVGRVRRMEGREPRVLLLGHSVGAYVVLEVLRRGRERLGMKADGQGEGDGEGEVPRVIGGVCLFPTVTHIARSKSGRRITLLFLIPHLPFLASLLTRLLTLLIPAAVLGALIRLLLRFPSPAATTTAAFLKSPRGVRQALHMAQDEMKTIAADAWDAEVWGAAAPSPLPLPRARLAFLFARSDHWVGDETRDELIRARGRRGTRRRRSVKGGVSGVGDGEVQEEDHWRPVMEIDGAEGWVHGFCIRHSVPVAERVRGYVEEMIEADLDMEGK